MALEIIIGEEYKIKVESGDKFIGSIFEELYRKATRYVEEIIKQSDSKSSSELSDDVYNNIIAFTGDRGTGKSSSMISFAEALVNKEKKEHKEFFENELNNSEELKSKKIASLPIIDPSLFKGNDKLFEIVVSKMFSNFQIYIKNNKEVDNDKKRRLISQFQKVYNNLISIHDDKQNLYKKEVIEALSELAYGTNLKSSFLKLVNLYLEIIEDNADFLIIAIDDFDLNISGAFQMLEDIRQFLIQKKIIILLSCKMEQLKDSVRLEIVKKTKDLYNHHVKEEDGYFTEDRLKDKAEKYLDKLIPLERKLNTKDVKIDNKINIEVFNGKDLLVKQKSFDSLILKLIYEKTGLFLPKSKNETNPFIPQNLRSLINYVSFLYSCTNLKSYSNFIQNQKHEFLKLKDVEIFENSDEFSAVHNEFYFEWIKSKRNIQNDPRQRKSIEINPEITTFYSVYEKYEITKSSYSKIDVRSLNEIKYIALNYSVQNLNIFNDRGNSFEIFNYGIIGTYSEVFPQEIIKNKRLSRDYFQIKNFKTILNLIDNDNDLIFILSFISIIGEESEFGDSIKSRIIHHKSNNPYVKATFSAFQFLIVLFNKDLLYIDRELSFSSNNDLSLLHSINSWENKSLILFSNIFFFEEFLKNIKYFTRVSTKTSLPENYGELLGVFLKNGITYSLDKLKKDYPYLKIDSNSVINNPIFNYWFDNENFNRLNHIIDILFKDRLSDMSSIDKSVSELAQKMILHYNKYFESNEYSPRGVKQAMNSIVKNFRNYKDEYLELKKFRVLMDRDLDKGINEIYNYLNYLSNR